MNKMITISSLQVEKQLRLGVANDKMWAYQEADHIARGLVGDY